jgi:uncharacterized protein
MARIETVENLLALYQPAPAPTAIAKELDHVSEHYARLIAASPFLILATNGPEGLDCSPRGDRTGWVRIADPKTVMLPDRRGNNRVDSLRNIVRDGRAALLFLIPGSGTTLRVNGRAEVRDDPELRESFAVDGQAPRTVIVVHVEAAYFQCARAIVRSDLWNPDAWPDLGPLPTPGEMLSAITAGEVGGPDYDAAWPARMRQSLW